MVDQKLKQDYVNKLKIKKRRQQNQFHSLDIDNEISSKNPVYQHRKMNIEKL